MNTITFDKNYTKLPADIKTAVLVAVEPVKLFSQTYHFLHYDCEYQHSDGNYNSAQPFYDYMMQHSKIEKPQDKDYLCLVLKSDSGAIFTTLRKDNAENREKYMYSIKSPTDGSQIGGVRYGEQFQIIIKEG